MKKRSNWEILIDNVNKKYPQIGVSFKKTMDRIHFYQNTFNYSDDEAIKLIKGCPQILGLDTDENNPTSVKNKMIFTNKHLILQIKN